MYPYHLGRQAGPIGGQQPTGLSLEHRLLPEHLQQRGYSTHMLGKWHLGFCRPEYLPTNRGFDTHYGFWNGAQDYYDKTVGGGRNKGYDFHDGLDVDMSANGTYSEELYSTRADRILRAHAQTSPSDPLFLYFAMQSSHTPLQAPQRYLDLYPGETNLNRTKFKAVVSAMDETVGNLVQSLKDTGMYENSVILFLGDNGGSSGQGASNFPLRGSKNSLWEGGVRTPAFLHSPLLASSTRTLNSLLHVTDWLPTLLRAAGASLEQVGALGLDGMDQWEALTSPDTSTTKRQDMVINISLNRRNLTSAAYRLGDHKVVIRPGRKDGWDAKSGEQEPGPGLLPNQVLLFNIAEDPQEREDLASTLPELRDQLVAKVEELRLTSLPVDDPAEVSGAVRDGVWVTGWC